VDDDSGQVILMMAIIIVICMVVLLLYLNQSMLAGRSSSISVMNFPKDDIRELKKESIAEAYTIGKLVNNNNVSDKGKAYNDNFTYYANNITSLYVEKGSLINITSTPGIENGKIVNATVKISYKNGETTYSENIIILVAD